VKEEKEQEVPTEEGGANLSQKLDNPSPPKVDKKKVGYVTREIIIKRLPVVRLKF